MLELLKSLVFAVIKIVVMATILGLIYGLEVFNIFLRW